MRVAVLHNVASDNAPADEQDVWAQVAAVSGALEHLGHEALCIPCTLHLKTVKRRLLELRLHAVFNLVESLGGTDRLMFLATALLDSLCLPYTGASTQAILATASKVAAKGVLQQNGLPTPAWFAANAQLACAGVRSHEKYIIKTVYEHGSVSLDDTAVVSLSSADELTDAIRQRSDTCGRPCFAEQFVDGREFNLSLLAGPDGAEVLPPAEIDFSAFGADKPRIVGYRAKWDDGSSEYQQTPRRFDFLAADRELLQQLTDLAGRCWRLFALRGYARVDFRVDGQRRPWILEVNANPCLSPNAGFAAAVRQAGIEYDEAIRRIIEDVHYPTQ